jgi:RNA polymerase sigma factor (sigma-70 family)
MATGLGKVLAHLQQSGAGPTDGQLLGRFVAGRDEASFAALVRRHGPMVLGVCRRVLRDYHDAEDAFQATFLILARKAASVVRRESVGCWLYQVAYHTALEASATSARRRARERPMKDMPHPEVAPPEAQDWRPLLDRELSRLPEKYRAAVVLCDLEGRSRRDAARQLGVPEGTLSSRLAAARQMLAKRLAGCGLALSGGALASAMVQGTASAQVPAALVLTTAKAAALVAAGQLAAGATPAALLMQGVMKAMLLKKLRLVVGAVMVLVAFGAVGVAYHAADGSGAARAAEPDKPRNELEALRKENELLKLNLQVVLEKVRAQETEIRGLRKDVAAMTEAAASMQGRLVTLRGVATSPPIYLDNLQGLRASTFLLNSNNGLNGSIMLNERVFDVVRPIDLAQPAQPDAVADATKEAESAVKALREAKDKEAQRRAAEALDRAMKKLKEKLK